MNINERYLGKPLLRILECFVLSAIGKLTKEEEKKLNNMSPKLQEIYKVNGTWYEIISSVMEFPKSLASQIDEIWKKNYELAKANGEELIPQDFAEMFVDNNFST